VIIDNSGDDSDRGKGLIRFWKEPQDWTQDNTDGEC
jgi:hypothetical protein